jgi:hypothetical protein
MKCNWPIRALSLLLVLISISFNAHAASDTFIIVCEGKSTRTIITFDNQTIRVPAKADTQTFKIGPDSINSKKCGVATDALLICSSQYNNIDTSRASDPSTAPTDIYASEKLDRYSGKIVSTSTLHYRGGKLAKLDDEFVGYCKRAKKRL